MLTNGLTYNLLKKAFMHRSIVYFFLFFLFCALGNLAFAQEEPVRTSEQQVVTQWVVDNAQINLTVAKATALVSSVYSTASKNELDPLLVLSVMQVESGFNQGAKSRSGARGAMQVVPYWHRDKLKGRNPMNLLVSIEVGTQVLKDCWELARGNVARTLRCYNGGGDRHYSAKVLTQRKLIRRSVIEAQFQNQDVLIASR